MKAIDMTQALINANDVTINKVDALVETSVLKQLIESCKARVEELEPEAKKLAEQKLVEKGEVSGKFDHEGHHYTLDVTPVFDIVGKPQKYNAEDGVLYRKKFKEQTELKKASAKLTREMKDIVDDFPDNHPNMEPDEVKKTLKCID